MSVLLVSLLSLATGAQQHPNTMTRAEVTAHSPDVVVGSFGSKPKVFYRAGRRYCRVEEAEDTVQRIHNVLIVNEPDYWTVNLFTNTAQHAVDPGPSFNCHLPIFALGNPESMDEETKKIRQLEFGEELAFFKSEGAMAEKGPIVAGTETTLYRVNVAGASLSLFMSGSPEHPLAVALKRGDKNIVLWYRSYGQIEFDPKLFEKPENARIEKSKP